jgi:hypothetical protein
MHVDGSEPRGRQAKGSAADGGAGINRQDGTVERTVNVL